MSHHACPAPGCPFQTTSQRALDAHMGLANKERAKNLKPTYCSYCEHHFCTFKDYDRHYPHFCSSYKKARREQRSKATMQESAIDVTALTAALGASNLAASVYHEVAIEFPATDLLPAGKLPYLTPPKDIELSDKPEAKDYAAALDSTDLSFVKLISVLSGKSMDEVPVDRYPDHFGSSMTRLAQAPGSSLLELVVCPDMFQEQLILYVRLTTDWWTHSGWVRDEKYFEIDQEDWVIETASAADEGWMKLLQSLMCRESVAAYFHVQEKLRAFDKNFVKEEEKSWSHDCLEKDQVLTTAEQLLCKRLWRMNDDGSSDFGYATSFKELDTDAVAIGLQCGHLKNLNVARLRCRCEQKVFDDPEEVLEAMHAAEQRRCASYLSFCKMFEETKYSNGRAFVLDLGEIPDAIDAALRTTMQAPVSVIPKELSLIHSPLVHEVASGMRRYLTADLDNRKRNGGEVRKKLTLEETFNSLRTIAYAIMYRGSTDSSDVGTPVMSLNMERSVGMWIWRSAVAALANSEVACKEADARDFGGIVKEMKGMALD